MHYINKLLIVRLISYTTGRESRIMCDSGQKLKHFHEKKKKQLQAIPLLFVIHFGICGTPSLSACFIQHKIFSIPV